MLKIVDFASPMSHSGLLMNRTVDGVRYGRLGYSLWVFFSG